MLFARLPVEKLARVTNTILSSANAKHGYTLYEYCTELSYP